MSEFQLPPPINSKDLVNLLCDTFNELYSTSSFKCFGKNGHKQKGIDILSTEKEIVIQSKLKDLTRKKILIKKELFADIDETINFILEKKPKVSFQTLYIATTFSEHPDFDEYCETLKTEKQLSFNVVFWGWETIQREVISLPKTLGKHYTNFIVPTNLKEDKVINKLAIKKRMRNDFLKAPEQINQVKLRNNPNEKFKYDIILIRSINDTLYPNNDDIFSTKVSPWFKVLLYDFYHNGIEVLLNRHIWNTAIVDANGKWKIIDRNKKIDEKKFKKIELAAVGRIPFDNIIDYDLEPDGINNEPHIYCDFKNNGEPYEEIIYVINNDGTDDNMMKSYEMDNANRIE